MKIATNEEKKCRIEIESLVKHGEACLDEFNGKHQITYGVKSMTTNLSRFVPESGAVVETLG